jgi:hypothetical protein
VSDQVVTLIFTLVQAAATNSGHLVWVDQVSGADQHQAATHKVDIFHILIKVMQHRALVVQVVTLVDIGAQTAAQV